MGLTIEIPDEMRDRLQEWAQQAQTSEGDVILRALDAYLAVDPNLREELTDWQVLGAESIELVAPIANEAW
jgi:predicted transcriptional regulator